MESNQEADIQKEVSRKETEASTRCDREQDTAEDISVKQVDRPQLSHSRTG